MLRVQAAVGPKVLSGNGVTGRVLVAFSIGTDGSLLGVRLAQSRGNDRLDAQAIQVVANVTFPAPPCGMNVISRSYISAFTFT